MFNNSRLNRSYFQALGSVKCLEIIVLFWRYINPIELNRNMLHKVAHCCMLSPLR